MKDSEICNFANDATIYTNGHYIESEILSLEEGLSNTLNLFRVYHLAATHSKFQVMFLGMREQPKLILDIIDITTPLLIKALCQIANRKVSAFSRVTNFLNYEKGKILYNTFVISNFNYYPLIWVYHGKTASNRVDRVEKTR